MWTIINHLQVNPYRNYALINQEDMEQINFCLYSNIVMVWIYLSRDETLFILCLHMNLTCSVDLLPVNVLENLWFMGIAEDGLGRQVNRIRWTVVVIIGFCCKMEAAQSLIRIITLPMNNNQWQYYAQIWVSFPVPYTQQTHNTNTFSLSPPQQPSTAQNQQS